MDHIEICQRLSHNENYRGSSMRAHEAHLARKCFVSAFNKQKLNYLNACCNMFSVVLVQSKQPAFC